MINKTLFSVFKQGSKTYFYSSIFFPSYMKKDVFALYGFVRKADNYVDSIPQDVNGFYNFKEKYEKAINGKKTDDIIIDSFVELSNKKKFDEEWTESFLASMESDIIKSKYETIDEIINYMYGSAEVIGLFMAKIMNLNEDAYHYAKFLGRSMQYINFIRDINDDIKLGRTYMPQNEIKKYGIKSLDYDFVKEIPEKYTAFIHNQLKYYCEWQHEAEEGFKFIPKRYLIPVKTASEMYNWTAKQIYNNPFIIYKAKVKPQISKILSTTIMNIIDPRSTNKCRPILNINPKINPELEY